MDVSIIIPLFNESESLKELDDWISLSFKYKDLEFVYTIQGNGARLIITKEKKQKSGLARRPTLHSRDPVRRCSTAGQNMGASLLSFGLDTGVRSHQPEKRKIPINPVCESLIQAGPIRIFLFSGWYWPEKRKIPISPVCERI